MMIKSWVIKVIKDLKVLKEFKSIVIEVINRKSHL